MAKKTARTRISAKKKTSPKTTSLKSRQKTTSSGVTQSSPRRSTGSSPKIDSTVASKKPSKSSPQAVPNSAVRATRSKARSSQVKTPHSSAVESASNSFFYIGIGASAGGLEALRALVSGLRDVPDASLIVVQHLSPQHRSMLVDLLSRETRLNVREAQDGDVPKANTIYITPPNSDLFFEGGRLRLRKPLSKIGPKPSVDLFFESLAEEAGEQAVGIILSGTGSDGSRGIRAIKAAGGLTIAQTPSSAKYDGMPLSAIESGSVDLVADIGDIAVELNQLGQLAQRERIALQAKSEDPYHDLIGRLKLASGVDFAFYKPNTIRRRLHRRMMATHVASLEEYLSYVDESPKELTQLFQDVLISVTCFFRDSSAFEELRKQITRQIRGSDFNGGVYRVWIPGCATGEEAYTIAMLVSDIAETYRPELKLQVFATDISEAALVSARKGLYPAAAVARVPQKFRNKYFTESNDGYQMRREIRDTVVFARQDLLKDPPFLKLDLISCRNLFIYFKPEVQERIFRVFHYALSPQGLLFLGKSEALGRSETYFSQKDQGARIFGRRNAIPEIPASMRGGTDSVLQLKAKTDARDPNVETQALAAAIALIAPHSVVVDDQFNLKKVYGSMSELLKIPTGEMTHSLLKFVNPEVRSELTTLLHRCRKEKSRVLGRPREALVDGDLRTVQFMAVPLPSSGVSEFLVSLIQNTPVKDKKTVPPPHRSDDLGERVKELEQELAATREHQQTLVEELETSNEELQALNEELQSANEELQSSNEELETSNEELHATNEELTTLNEELNVKSSEVLALNEHLEGIQNAIRYPLFVVDPDLRLIRFNSACEEIFRMGDLALGKNARMVPTLIDLTPAYDALEKSLRTREPVTSTLRCGQGQQEKIFEIKSQPLVNDRDEAIGAVVVLVDVSDLAQALRDVQDKEALLQSILRNTPAVVSLKDASGRYQFVNDRFVDVMGWTREEVIGQTDDELFAPDIAQKSREHDFEALLKRQSIFYEEEFAIRSDEDTRVFYSAKVPLLDSAQDPRSICTISLDITERKRAEEMVRAQQEQLIRVGKLSALGEMAAGIAHELNTPLNAILGHVDVLEMLAEESALSAEEVLKSGRGIQGLVENISSIITGLRNLARMETKGIVKKDLVALVRETTEVCRLHLKNHGVRLKLSLPDKPLEAVCQPIQLSQVLINLLNNAVDAIDHKEEKWICVELVDKSKNAEIRVIDCGDGVPRHIADKMMTPFFTTKPMGKGTGMGLSLSQSIVGMHRGQLFLDRSHPNTCFTMVLPKTGPEKPSPKDDRGTSVDDTKPH